MMMRVSWMVVSSAELHARFSLWLTAEGAARDQSQAITTISVTARSGDDSIAVIAISGTESLMSRNLPLWSHF